MADLTHGEAIDLLPRTTPNGCRWEDITAADTEGMLEVRSPNPNPYPYPVGRPPRTSQ
ncbi:hypothetical protein [Kocuria sp. NPDC057446]|uniref:hypothetical protein n=1 Tax=Kocuria sp. NPDC057446 TaxID=3346137 RepID=UPI003674C179